MYKLNDEKMFYDMAEGQAIVINFTSGMYYGTSALGSVVLDAFLAGATKDCVLAALKATDGCPENIEAELDAFIAQLLEKEVVVEAPSSEVSITVDAAALQDGFVMTLDEFAEVQDLIMADPVHEVDVEMGWPVLAE